MHRQLLPDAKKARGVGIGILHDLLIVMDVDDHVEIVGQRLFDRPIDAGQKFGFNRIGRVGRSMRTPPDWNAYTVKAGLSDQAKIAFIERHPPFTFIVGLQRIAQVNPASQCLIDGKGI